MNFESFARRFARVTTDIVVRRPRLWFLLRWATRAQFDRLAPRWDEIRAGDTAYAPYEAALERVDPPPKRALDLGTGTGGAAFAIARRFPEAELHALAFAGHFVLEDAMEEINPLIRGFLVDNSLLVEAAPRA